MTQYELITIIVALAALVASAFRFVTLFKCQICESNIIKNYGDAYTYLCRKCSNSEAGIQLMEERKPQIYTDESLETISKKEEEITMEDKTVKQTFPLTFEQLRILFISGCAINTILFFVPSAKVRMGFFATQERLLSSLDAVRLAFQMHQAGIGLLGVAFIAAMVVFLVLALKEPKRWVFIAGAAVSAFFILFDLFQPSSPNVEYLLLPRLAGWIASVSILSGFWATPPEMAPQQ